LRLPWITSLLERLAECATPDFAGMVSGLYVGDRLAAAHLGLRSRTSWHYYVTSYDRELAAYSPGLIMLVSMARVAPELGLRTIESFEWQMAFLTRKRRVVPLEWILGGRATAGRPAVAITFDDGYRSFLTAAAPVLGQHGFPATLFIPTGWIGESMRWEPQPADAVDLEIMTPEEIQACQDMGYEIGSHGHAHAHMAALPPSMAE